MRCVVHLEYFQLGLVKVAALGDEVMPRGRWVRWGRRGRWGRWGRWGQRGSVFGMGIGMFWVVGGGSLLGMVSFGVLGEAGIQSLNSVGVFSGFVYLFQIYVLPVWLHPSDSGVSCLCKEPVLAHLCLLRRFFHLAQNLSLLVYTHCSVMC